jgi:flagellar biogenesis protein FliO
MQSLAHPTPPWAAALRDRLAAQFARLPGLARMAAPFTGPRHVQLVQALPLGPGSRLLVVEFAGQRLLIGQSRAGLTRLAEAAD